MPYVYAAAADFLLDVDAALLMRHDMPRRAAFDFSFSILPLFTVFISIDYFFILLIIFTRDFAAAAAAMPLMRRAIMPFCCAQRACACAAR